MTDIYCNEDLWLIWTWSSLQCGYWHWNESECVWHGRAVRQLMIHLWWWWKTKCKHHSSCHCVLFQHLVEKTSLRLYVGTQRQHRIQLDEENDQSHDDVCSWHMISIVCWTQKQSHFLATEAKICFVVYHDQLFPSIKIWHSLWKCQGHVYVQTKSFKKWKRTVWKTSDNDDGNPAKTTRRTLSTLTP